MTRAFVAPTCALLLQTAPLEEAGGEALLFDWKETGRPLWADTSESVQIIDTKAK